MSWPAPPQIDRDEQCAHLVGLLRDLADHLKFTPVQDDPEQPTRVYPEPAVLPHLGYERYVEAPRKAGRDPVYDSLMAEALAHLDTKHKAAS